MHTACYIFCEDLLRLSDNFTRCKERASRVHSLINAYKLFPDDVRIIRPQKAHQNQLTSFHDSDFIEFLLQCSEEDKENSSFVQNCENFGLQFECPVLDELGDYVLYLAGAAIDSAQCLNLGLSKIAINWFGGWHHGRKDYAAGYCYINDCVLSILELRKTFDKVLYIDLDVHHGDGVQEAFYCTNKVFTLSFHRYTPGLFYPGTGDISEIGSYKGHGYCLNVPFQQGLKSDSFVSICRSIIADVMNAFKPNAILCQCGADALAHDPVEGLNITPMGYVKVVEFIKSFDLPLLIVGGGGYNRSNTAKCWTSIQSLLIKDRILLAEEDIPEHEYLDEYGPTYTIEVKESKMKDLNTESYLNDIVQKSKAALSSLSH